MAGNKLIDLIDITKTYGSNTVLDSLNLYIRENEQAKTTQGPSVRCDLPVGPIYDLDIFVIPSGDVDEKAVKLGMVSWITRQYEQSQYLLTVCTGTRM